MLRKIDTLILRSFVGPFLAAFSVILFILVLQFLTKYLDDIFGKGFEMDVLAKVFVYACATLVTMALPLGILLSSLMTVGGMGESYELAALKSSGVGLFKTMRPLIGATIVITLFSTWFSFFVIPVVNLKLYTLLYDLGKVKPSFAIKPKHFYTGLDNYVIHVNDVDRETDFLYKIRIYDHREDIGNLKIIMADSGRMMPNQASGNMMIELYHGVSHEDMPKEVGKEKNFQYQRYYFDTLLYRVQLTGFEMEESDPSTFAPHHYMQDIVELYETRAHLIRNIDSIGSEFGKYIGKYVFIDSALVDPGYLDRKQELRQQEELEKRKRNEELEKGKEGVKSIIKPAGLYSVHPDTAKRKEIPPPKAGKLPPAKTYYKVDNGKPVLQWFDAVFRTDIMNKSIHSARAVKNFSVVMMDRLKNEQLKERKFTMEMHGRLMLPVSCLIFLLLGAPLGAIIRKGGIGIPILFSILFFILFYFLMMWGKKFARDDILPVWVGIWLPCLVMFPFGVLFTYKAARDAPIFNSEIWGKVFKQINLWLFAWWWPKKKVKKAVVTFWDNPKFNLTPEELEQIPSYLRKPNE